MLVLWAGYISAAFGSGAILNQHHVGFSGYLLVYGVLMLLLGIGCEAGRR